LKKASPQRQPVGIFDDAEIFIRYALDMEVQTSGQEQVLWVKLASEVLRKAGRILQAIFGNDIEHLVVLLLRVYGEKECQPQPIFKVQPDKHGFVNYLRVWMHADPNRVNPAQPVYVTAVLPTFSAI